MKSVKVNSTDNFLCHSLSLNVRSNVLVKCLKGELKRELNSKNVFRIELNCNFIYMFKKEKAIYATLS